MADIKIANYSTATQWEKPRELTNEEQQQLRDAVAKLSDMQRRKDEMLVRIGLRWPMLTHLFSNPKFMAMLHEAMLKDEQEPRS